MNKVHKQEGQVITYKRVFLFTAVKALLGKTTHLTSN